MELYEKQHLLVFTTGELLPDRDALLDIGEVVQYGVDLGCPKTYTCQTRSVSNLASWPRGEYFQRGGLYLLDSARRRYGQESRSLQS